METMNKINRFIRHVRQGTLSDRIYFEWQKRKRDLRLRSWNAKISGREYIVECLDPGVKIKLFSDSQLSKMIYVNDFERTERDFLRAYLKKGDTFADVGANIGLFSLIAAEIVGSSGKVFSFEPTPHTYKRLMKNVELNGFKNIQCFQLALSNKIEKRNLFASRNGFDAWNSLAFPMSKDSYENKQVQCETWDRFAQIHQMDGKLEMMKIDVEGWESHVLGGSLETLRRKNAPLLQIEFNDNAATASGISCKELYGLLEDLGYRLYTYNAKKNTLIHDPIREKYSSINLLAAKNIMNVYLRLNS